jgi:two-component system chemotaxis sensor kinase CheA
MPAFKKEPTEGLLVIIKDVRKKIALLVDDILGQEQVVIKSMRENYKQVDSVAGATVMGDGRVAAILDVPTLIKMAGRIKLAG